MSQIGKNIHLTISGTPPIDPPISRQFKDLYFSADNGLAESEFVFLGGNNLPEGWQGSDRYVIGELGFGTGLNFLAAWKLFDDMARLSHNGTTLATYTAAGQVRRDLTAAGFVIEKVPGYGRKRHMTVGQYAGATP